MPASTRRTYAMVFNDLHDIADEEYKLDMRYAQAEDYPIDLYYLMDLSKSMEDDKLTLESLGANLTLAMKTITSNFRLGFGSFVDKVLMPYVSTVPDKYVNICNVQGSCRGLKMKKNKFKHFEFWLD